MIYIGIDPGIDGAIAFIADSGAILAVENFQTMIVRGKKREYALPLVLKTIERFAPVNPSEAFVVLEMVHAFPGQGVVSMWSMGRSTGVWEGILSTLEIPYEKVPPQRWKKVMMDGMPKEKGSSIVVASRLFPGLSLPRKKDHNKADALLMAEYGRRIHGGKK